MTAKELKTFLRLCGLKVSGKKEELVARVFVAAEKNMHVFKTAQEVQAEIVEDYVSKLRVEGALLPDPMSFIHGWVPEDGGVRLWPMTIYPDIFNFLSLHPSKLKARLE